VVAPEPHKTSSEPLRLTSSSSPSTAPPIPYEAYAEAANGIVLDSNDWMDLVLMLVGRRLAELKSQAGQLLILPSREQDEKLQSYAMRAIHKRGICGHYLSSHQHPFLNALFQDEEDFFCLSSK